MTADDMQKVRETACPHRKRTTVWSKNGRRIVMDVTGYCPECATEMRDALRAAEQETKGGDDG